MTQEHDHTLIDSPPHYTSHGIETIDAIYSCGDETGDAFCLGNAIKYLLRCRHKGTLVQDLYKAHWYLCKLIMRLEGHSVGLMDTIFGLEERLSKKAQQDNQ